MSVNLSTYKELLLHDYKQVSYFFLLATIVKFRFSIFFDACALYIWSKQWFLLKIKNKKIKKKC